MTEQARSRPKPASAPPLPLASLRRGNGRAQGGKSPPPLGSVSYACTAYSNVMAFSGQNIAQAG